MTALESLLILVDLVDPLGIGVELLIDLVLASHVRVNAAEVCRAPHLIGVELVGAAVLIASTCVGIVDAIEEGIACLKA